MVVQLLLIAACKDCNKKLVQLLIPYTHRDILRRLLSKARIYSFKYADKHAQYNEICLILRAAVPDYNEPALSIEDNPTLFDNSTYQIIFMKVNDKEHDPANRNKQSVLNMVLADFAWLLMDVKRSFKYLAC